MLDDDRKRALSLAFERWTGQVPRLEVDEADDAGQLLVWDLPTGVKYALRLGPPGPDGVALSLGARHGPEPVLTRLDGTFARRAVEGLLRDPMELVGVLLGHRSAAALKVR